MYFEAFGTSQNPNEIPNPRFSSRLHRVWDHFFWFYLPTKRKVADHQVKPFQERQLQRARTAPRTRDLFILQNPRQATPRSRLGVTWRTCQQAPPSAPLRPLPAGRCRTPRPGRRRGLGLELWPRPLQLPQRPRRRAQACACALRLKSGRALARTRRAAGGAANGRRRCLAAGRRGLRGC